MVFVKFTFETKCCGAEHVNKPKSSSIDICNWKFPNSIRTDPIILKICWYYLFIPPCDNFEWLSNKQLEFECFPLVLHGYSPNRTDVQKTVQWWLTIAILPFQHTLCYDLITHDIVFNFFSSLWLRNLMCGTNIQTKWKTVCWCDCKKMVWK